MPHFIDSTGREWSVLFDGLTLKDLRDEHGINLADLGASDYARIESDAAALVEALVALCRPQLTSAGLTAKQFSAALTGEALESGLEAIRGAAKVFFPPRMLSVLESNWGQHREMRQAMALLPPGMSGELMSGALQTLLESRSATGQAAIPSTPALSTPATAASTREG